MHLIVYFYGTGSFDNRKSDPHGLGVELGLTYPPSLYDDIGTISIYGCSQEEVCNALLFPNLSKYAKRFVDKLFSRKTDQTTLSTSNLRSLQIGVDTDNSSLPSNAKNAKIESITLVGYSRGAVTCFNVAQELNQVAPDIPVNIVAAEPVPGNLYAFPGSNAASIADCSSLGNLKNVSIIIGAHSVDDNVFLENAFFSQIVPKLPETANRNLILTPAATHQDRFQMTGALVQVELAKSLNDSNALGEEGKETVALLEKGYADRCQGAYSEQMKEKRKRHYPLARKLQRVFGVDKKELLKHQEKLHPKPYLRSGLEWGENEKLINWWRKHDKKIILPPSKLTKELIGSIKNSNENEAGSLLKLFKQADIWLLKNAFTSSPRYENVLQLRNNLYDRLIHKFGFSEEDLKKESRIHQQETHYLTSKWQNLSTLASPFKTEATKTLDKVFQEHDQKPPSYESDKKLLKALDTWIESKTPHDSKRYNYVLLLREEMQKMMTSLYPEMAKTQDLSSAATTQTPKD